MNRRNRIKRWPPKPKCDKCDTELEAYTCGYCAGSGEGQHDGTKCMSCGGSGESDDRYCPQCEEDRL